MAKRQPTDEDERPEPTPDNAVEEEARPGESLDDFMQRRDAEEAEWRGKKGGEGPSTHDANEHRHPQLHELEDYDPWLGKL